MVRGQPFNISTESLLIAFSGGGAKGERDKSSGQVASFFLAAATWLRFLHQAFRGRCYSPDSAIEAKPTGGRAAWQNVGEDSQAVRRHGFVMDAGGGAKGAAG